MEMKLTAGLMKVLLLLLVTITVSSVQSQLCHDRFSQV